MKTEGGEASSSDKFFLRMWRDVMRVWDSKAPAAVAKQEEAEEDQAMCSLEEDLIEEAERMVGRAKESRDVVFRLLMLWQLRWGLGGAQVRVGNVLIFHMPTCSLAC